MRSYEIISIFTYGLSKLIPKKKNRWIFGAWFGDAISDNTKAFYDYIALNHPEIERIWVVKDPVKANPPGCKVIKRNSIKSLKYILTAKVAVMNQGYGDFAAYNFLGGTFKVQLWHGVAWKEIGRDAVPDLKGIYEKVFQLINHYDLYIAPSKLYGASVKSAFKTNEDHIVYVGQPRNEVLFREEFKKNSRLVVERKIGVYGKKILVYMPTFRDKTSNIFSFCSIESDNRFIEMAERLGFVIVEKLHYKNNQKKEDNNSKKYIYAMPDMDAASLLGAADILITDYSSCFFDYLITDRPIIHYAYDYDYYKNKDRGLYYDINDVAAGSIASTEQELLNEIENCLINDTGSKRRNEIRDKFITYESANNCTKIFDEVMTRICY